MSAQLSHEPQEMVDRYARRAGLESRYATLDSYNLRVLQERQRALSRLLRRHTRKPVDTLQLLEIGCGVGTNLLELLWFGFTPQKLLGNELLEERVAQARRRLPSLIDIHAGDAVQLSFDERQFDIVYQSTVFTSLLDRNFQHKLADKMWSLVLPGGGVLWYDFTINNPRNPDVRGVPTRRIRELFPQGKLYVRRVTLAPPLGRLSCRLYPGLYGLINSLPWLRTHVLCWIEKPLI